MNRIAELRKEMNLNQVGLAMKLNVSQYMISAYETGRHQPTADMLIVIADFFNVSIDYLLKRSNIRSTADNISKDNLSEQELKMLCLYRTLPKEKKEQALGVVFALKNI